MKPACRNCGIQIPCPVNARRAIRRGYGFCSHSCAAPKTVPAEIRFVKHVSPEPNTGCWIWCGPLDVYGYGVISSGGAADSGSKHLRAHRVSFEIHNGRSPEHLHVCHTCDNRWCVNPLHLFLDSNAGNLCDMRKKRRHAHGEKIPWAKLTETMVREIRISSDSNSSVARMHGVSAACIAAVRKRRTWSHVSDEIIRAETGLDPEALLTERAA